MRGHREVTLPLTENSVRKKGIMEIREIVCKRIYVRKFTMCPVSLTVSFALLSRLKNRRQLSVLFWLQSQLVKRTRRVYSLQWQFLWWKWNNASKITVQRNKKKCYSCRKIIEIETFLWPGLSVCRLVFHNFPKLRDVSLQWSYRSFCYIICMYMKYYWFEPKHNNAEMEP